MTNNPSVLVTIIFQKQLSDENINFSLINKNEYSKCTKHNTYFNCLLNSYGIFKFKYSNSNKSEIELDKKVYVYDSFDKLFDISIERNVSCYHTKEKIIYRLTEKQANIIDNIDIILQNDQNEIIKFVKENNTFISAQEKKDNSNYILKIIENDDEDKDNYLYKKENIQFTNVNVKYNYFFPKLKKMIFNSNCDFQPNNIQLNNTYFSCNRNSKYNSITKEYFCYLNDTYSSYGKVNIFFQNELISENIFSSKLINETIFDVKVEQMTKNFKEYRNILITNSLNDFYLDSINNVYINYSDYSKEPIKYNKIEDKDSFNISYNNLYFSLYISYEFGYSYDLYKLEREIFSDESIETDYLILEGNKFSNKTIINYTLDNIKFEPDYVFLGYINNDFYNSETKLIFKNNESYNLYGSAFCINEHNNLTLKSTNQFNCIKNDNESSYFIKSPISEPGILKTQLKQYTKEIELNIIRFDFENICQDIYGDKNILDDVNLYFYVPKNASNNLIIKYNGNIIEKNNNININNNPFNYTLVAYYIEKENILESAIVEIYFNTKSVFNFTIGYSSIKLPTLVNEKFRIEYNEIDNFKEIEIKFSKKITNLSDSDINNFFLWTGNQSDITEECILKNDNQTLHCKNELMKKTKSLYFKNKCNNTIKLDYTLNLQHKNISITIDKHYFIISNDIQLIELILRYKDNSKNFPYKVYVNNDDVAKIHTIDEERNYIYYTKKVGDYKFSYLTSNNEIIEINETISIKNNINEIFSIMQPNKKCVYYKESIKYNLRKENDINEKFIKYTFHNESNLENLKCNINNDSNDCTFNLKSDSPIVKNLTFYSDNSENEFLSKETFIFTYLTINPIIYSSKFLILNSECLFENLKIVSENDEEFYLNCNFLSKSQLYCEIINNNKNLLGLYYLYYGDDKITSFYFNIPIEEANFTIEPNNISIGINNIYISTNDINLDSIKSIKIINNENEIINYELNSRNYPFFIDDEKNNINLTLIAYPGKSYYLQIYNGEGISKLYNFNSMKNNIEFNLNTIYYNKIYNDIPILEIKGDNVSKIEYIYYRKEDSDFNEKNKFSGKSDNDNKKTFILNIENKGTYIFAYTISNSNLKFNILNNKLIVDELFVVMNPIPKNNFLLSMDFLLTIVPSNILLLKESFLVYFGDVNYNPIVNLTIDSYNDYFIKSNDLKSKLNPGENYNLIIKTMSTNDILFNHKIIFSDFEFEKAYFKSLGYITIKNTNEKIDGLTIIHINNKNQTINSQKKQQYFDKYNKVVTITFNNNIMFGEYIVSYIDNEKISKFLISKDIIDSDFVAFLTGNNNIIISQSIKDFYLPFITSISLYKNNNIYTLIKEDIIYYENEYIQFKLNDSPEKITKIILYCESLNQNKELKLSQDNIRNFILNNTYQIIDHKNIKYENITLKFNEKITEEIKRRIFINERLILNDECSIINNQELNCRINSNNYNEIMFSYNEYNESIKKYIFYHFEFNGDYCITEGDNKRIYTLNVFNYPYLVYLNDVLLNQKDENGNYLIDVNILEYGENNIVFKESENDYSIPILTIQYNQKLILSIVDIEISNIYYFNPFFIQIKTFSGKIIGKNLSDIISNLYINKDNEYINININYCNYLEKEYVYHCKRFNNSKYNLTKGFYEIIYENKCNKHLFLGNFEVINENEQKLLSISPNYIKINEDITKVTLTFSKNLGPNIIHSISFIRYETNRTETYLIFTIFEVKDNIIYFNYKKSEYTHLNNIDYLVGTYKLSINYKYTEPFISKKTIRLINRINLYEKKQRFVKSTLNSFIIVLTGIIDESLINKITYNNTILNFTVKDNIIEVKNKNDLQQNIIDFTQTGNYIFNIYENEFENEPLIYTIEIIDNIDNIIFNHYIYKRTVSNNAYIILSLKDNSGINIQINEGNIKNNISDLTILYTITSINIGPFDFYYRSGNGTYINEEPILIVDRDSFIYDKRKTCFINYCSIENQLKDNCFEELRFINNYNDLKKTKITYKISSSNYNKNLTNNFKEYLYLPNDIENNKEYLFQILRSDSLENDALLYESLYKITNITNSTIIYKDHFIKVNLTLFCEDNSLEKLLTINNTKLKKCNYDSNNYIYSCDFEIIKSSIEKRYDLIFNNKKIINSIIMNNTLEFEIISFFYKGKAIFKIHILNSELYNSYNIKEINISNSNKNKVKRFTYNEIIYESNDIAYVELTKGDLSDSILLTSFKLFNGIEIIKDSNIMTFNEIYSIYPNYIFSNDTYSNISFNINLNPNSILLNFYLINGKSEYNLECNIQSKNNWRCEYNPIQFGLDYSINYYNNIILHTVQYYFENKCKTIKNKDNNSSFILKSMSEIKNINTLPIDLIHSESNKKVSNVKITFNDLFKSEQYYKFDIDTSNLNNGTYFIKFNNTNLKNEKLVITQEKEIKNIFGNIFSNYNGEQFIIIQFNETIEIKEILLLKNNIKIQGNCETILDDSKSILCKINNDKIENGNYDLQYIDECSSYIKTQKKIEIKNSINFIPLSQKIIFDINNNINIKIKFNNEDKINNLNIFLIKTDLLNLINGNQINVTSNLDTIKIPNNISLGNYFIKTQYLDYNLYTITPLFIVYDSNFDIKDYSPLIVKSFNLSNLIIDFNKNGQYNKNQIRNTYFVDDKNKKTEIKYQFNANKNQLTFENNDIELNKTSQNYIEIISDIKNFYYYIHIITIPSKFITTTTSSLILNKNNVYFDLKATNYLQNIISSITDSKNNQQFEIYYCREEICRIGKKKEVKQLKNSEYSEINFYDLNNVKIGYLGMTIYPKTYLDKYFPINNNITYSSYKSDDEGENTYITLIPFNAQTEMINTLSNLNVFKTIFPHISYNYYYIDYNLNMLLYVYSIYGENNNHTLLMKHQTENNKIIKANINLTICNNPGEIYHIKNGKITCEKCSSIDSNYPYKAAGSNKCVKNCDIGYLYKKHESCYLDCESIKTNKQLYIEEKNGIKECVLDCNPLYGRDFQSSLICHKCENKKYPKNGICVDCNENWCLDFYIENENTNNNCNGFNCINGICNIKNNEPYCECNENYFGSYCEYGKEEAIHVTIDLINDFLSNKSSINDLDEDRFESYKDENGDIIYVIDDDNNVKKIRKISNLIKNVEIMEGILNDTSNSNSVNELFNACSRMVSKAKTDEKFVHTNILEFIDLAINIFSSKYQYNKKYMRNLQYNGDGNITYDLFTINEIMENASMIYLNITLKELQRGTYNLNMATSEYNITRSLYYQRWTILSYNQIKNQIMNNSDYNELMYIDYTSCVKEGNILFINIILPTELSTIISSKNTTYVSPKTLTKAYKYTIYETYEYDLTNCDNITVYFPFNHSGDYINLESYTKYKKENIDIYNPNEKAFNDNCYITKYLNYDLNTNFRKYKIFENKTFLSENCIYDSIDLELKKIKMLCEYQKKSSYDYYESKIILNNLKSIEHLFLFKCIGKVEKISINIGFYLYLFFYVLTIICIIIHRTKKDEFYTREEMKNDIIDDELYYEKKNRITLSIFRSYNGIWSERQNSRIVSSSRIDNQSIRQSIMEEGLNTSLIELFGRNFYQLHPFLIFCRVSVISPFEMNLICFSYNVLLIFGFNALCYTEKLIEKRIKDENRKLFVYPLIKEFPKLILSLFFTIVFTSIIKLILFITIEKKNKLIGNIVEKGPVYKYETVTKFGEEMKKKRLIAKITMFIISLFFFFYSIIFCSIYRKTQFSWFFGGIWCLIFEWCILGPIYILVVSIVQKKDSKDYTFYLKRFYCF